MDDIPEQAAPRVITPYVLAPQRLLQLAREVLPPDSQVEPTIEWATALVADIVRGWPPISVAPQCTVCYRPLTAKRSVEALVGPKCAAKQGVNR